MFTASATFYPAAGKAAEFRQLAEERARALQAAGIETTLGATAWGPDFPAYRIGMRFATLADYEQARPAAQEVNRRFNPMMGPLARQTGIQTLTEVLQLTNQSGPRPKWGLWILRAPALGKGPELRALELERGKELEAQGRRSTLSVQVAGPESGVFIRNFGYQSLAALEEQRVRTAADASSAAFVSKLNTLLSRPTETSIREVLIPFNQR